MGYVTSMRAATQRLVKTITIQRPAIELYLAWRDLTRRPSMPHHVRLATMAGIPHPSLIRAPGVGIGGGAVLVDDIPGVLIAWRSMPGVDPVQDGEVRFHQTGQRGRTDVQVILTWQSSLTVVDEVVMPLYSRQMEARIGQELFHFRQLMELRSGAVHADDTHGIAAADDAAAVTASYQSVGA